MIKLSAGFSRKVGEANYGSRGASVNLELELESTLINDADGLGNRIRRLFEIARKSVDDELGRTPSNGQSNNGHSSSADQSNGRDQPRPATASQVRAIRAICQKQSRDADQFARERYGAAAVEQLSLREASTLIDELKSSASHGGTR